MRKTTSVGFREIFIALCSNLKEEWHWNLLRYLLFGAKLEDGWTLLDQWRSAYIEGKLKEKNSGRYCAAEFLSSFESAIHPLKFEWTTWTYKNKEARVGRLHLDEALQEALMQEIYNRDKNNRVYFVTGNKYTADQERIQRKIAQKEALTFINSAIPEAQELLNYLNNLPINSFSKVIGENFDAAILAASRIENPEKRRIETEVLYTIQDTLMPFYGPSRKGNTVRIFPIEVGIPMLQKKLRKILTKGWYEADLRNSQLAIVAKLWNIPEVNEFLATGQSIWVRIFDHFGLGNLKQTDIDRYEQIKSHFKDTLYALIFGMSRSNLIKMLTEALDGEGIPNAGKRFLQEPLIKKVYVARQERIKELYQIGKTTTIFGKELKVTTDPKTLKIIGAKGRSNIPNILAQEAQAIELALILPAFEALKKEKDAALITLMQHDGISIDFKKEKEKDRLIKKMKKAVLKKANELGVLTELEFEEL